MKTIKDKIKIYYRDILDNQIETVCRCTADGTITFVNDAYCKFFGKSREKLLGSKYWSHIPKEERQRDKEIFLSINKKNPEVVAEEKMIVNGEYRWIEWTGKAVLDKHGNLLEVQSVGRDITERKEKHDKLHYDKKSLEKEIKKRTAQLIKINSLLSKEVEEKKKKEQQILLQNELLNKFFSSTHLCVAYLDDKFNFIRVNKLYAELGGFSDDPNFYIGKNHFKLYPDKENQSIFERVLNTGETYTVYAKPFIFHHQQERGTTYWDWTLSAVKEENGKSFGLILTLADITKRKIAEEKIIELYKYLAVVNRQISILLNLNKEICGNRKEKILNYLLETSKKLSKADLIYFYRYDSKKQVFTILDGTNHSSSFLNKKGSVLSVKKIEYLKLILRKKRIQVSDKNYISGLIGKKDKISFFIFLPFLNGKKIIGLCIFAFHKKENISTQESDFYEAFAAQASLALQNIEK